MAAADMTMAEILEAYPGAQRALFRNFHIGGCASCGFRPDEPLGVVCERNQAPDAESVLAAIVAANQEDEKVLITPPDAATLRGQARFVDVRTAEEFEAVHIQGSERFTQALMEQAMRDWPKESTIVVVDHTGQRALDAAAYFSGHGFEHVRALRGGIDAWSEQVDPSLPRYTIE